jgi:formylglycine-generating enzyme required for sulfatase activity
MKNIFVEDLGNGVILEMAAIPGGTFIMGSPKEEENSMDSERPQHEVTIEPFFMGKYQVTQEQWRFVAQLPQVNRDLEQDPSRFKGDNRPVEQVSWEDAVEFCDRLSQYTGRTYRLPSEAEWEYACRAGTTTPFHFGETITTDLANYDGNSTYGDGVKGVDRGETTAVGSFGVANNFGLYDMHGNVYEWCQDHWHNNYEGAPTDGSAWLSNKKDSNRRLLRGGSWYYHPDYCRSAYRNAFNLDYYYLNIGFRVVCSAMCSKWNRLSSEEQQKFMNLEEIKDLALEDLANDTQLEMVAIPGGTFIMGSPENEEGYHSSQSPQHQVTVPPFFMGKYPVTQQQWRVVAALPKVNIDLESDPSCFKGDNLPVECVSWNDAQEFCARLSRMANKTYRLPTEAEWEYACRGGTTTPFYCGETISTDLANYNGNYTYGQGQKGEYRKKTTEVGKFPANPFGLYDMHGNVWEWCADPWHDNYTDAPADGSAWFSSDDKLSDKTGRVVLRGGSWYSYAGGCRSAYRNGDSRGIRDSYCGFRVVCSAMCSKLK